MARTEDYEVIVIGAGHAGCEAGLAAARMGARTLMLTLRLDSVGHMPCNCSVGGPGKTHLAREVDALGGEICRNTDRAYTHIRMLNTGKGPAVWALRAQCDKELYATEMRQVVENQPHLTLGEGCVAEVCVNQGQVTGVRMVDGSMLRSHAVVVTAGTFLRGLMHQGMTQTAGGRYGEAAVGALSESLAGLGLPTVRLKTGTPPRVSKASLNLSRLHVQPAATEPHWMSFENQERPARPGLLPCLLTRTTDRTREVVLENLHQSAMYGGAIEGLGPRYCPSIEDKFVRFPDRRSHPVWLEQEGWNCDVIYVQGMSTSLPAEIQLEMLHSMPGLGRVVMLRAGYAVEYDAVQPTSLKPSLETKAIAGLFLAGQLNGTSGYEEAAAQGWVAGVNAVLDLRNREPVILGRDQAYVGVLIDDLVTKGVQDPYRMLTARAEYRLLLRQDNADLRLTELGHELGVVDDQRYRRYQHRSERIESEVAYLENLRVSSLEAETIPGVDHATGAFTLAELLRRPEVTARDLAGFWPALHEIPDNIVREVETMIKYDGYITMQRAQVRKRQRAESQRIPGDFDYTTMPGLSRESREKLSLIQPRTLGHAARIQGIRPTDLTLLQIHLLRRTGGLSQSVSRETESARALDT